jgi:hypothetical protein
MFPDASAVRAAYARLLDAARAARGAPVDGDEWRPELVLAHVIVADRLVAGAVARVLADGQATFDSRASHSGPYLEAIVEAAGDWDSLVEAVRRGGAELAAAVERIEPEHAASVVQARYSNADGIVVDNPIELVELVTGCVSDHLPGHTHQLESYGEALTREGRRGSTRAG